MQPHVVASLPRARVECHRRPYMKLSMAAALLDPHIHTYVHVTRNGGWLERNVSVLTERGRDGCSSLTRTTTETDWPFFSVYVQYWDKQGGERLQLCLDSQKPTRPGLPYYEKSCSLSSGSATDPGHDELSASFNVKMNFS